MSQMSWSRDMPGRLQQGSANWMEIGFRQFWILGVVLLVLNIGRLSGAFNSNPMEKGVFLVALLLLCLRAPLNKPALVFLGLASLPVFVFGALTSYSDFSWLRLVMAYVALLSVAGFYVVTPSRRDSELILKSIAVLPVVLLLYGVLLFLAFGTPLMMRDHTGAMRLSGATIPAFLAAAGYAASVAAAYLYCHTRKTAYFLLCVAALVVSALSGSRTPTVVALASAATVLFMRFSGVQRIALVVLGGTGLVLFLATAGDQLVMRFMASSSSGRDMIWGIVESWTARFPHTGIGFGHSGAVIPHYVSRITGTEATHNEYLRLSLELGYWGCALFLAGFMFMCMAVVRRFSWEGLLLFSLFFLYAYTDNVFFLTYALMGPLACIQGLLLLHGAENQVQGAANKNMQADDARPSRQDGRPA